MSILLLKNDVQAGAILIIVLVVLASLALMGLNVAAHFQLQSTSIGAYQLQTDLEHISSKVIGSQIDAVYRGSDLDDPQHWFTQLINSEPGTQSPLISIPNQYLAQIEIEGYHQYLGLCEAAMLEQVSSSNCHRLLIEVKASHRSRLFSLSQRQLYLYQEDDFENTGIIEEK